MALCKLLGVETQDYMHPNIYWAALSSHLASNGKKYKDEVKEGNAAGFSPNGKRGLVSNLDTLSKFCYALSRLAKAEMTRTFLVKTKELAPSISNERDILLRSLELADLVGSFNDNDENQALFQKWAACKDDTQIQNFWDITLTGFIAIEEKAEAALTGATAPAH